MIDREIDIQTSDGAMNTFITHTEEGGPHPLVLLLMDARGKRSADQIIIIYKRQDLY